MWKKRKNKIKGKREGRGEGAEEDRMKNRRKKKEKRVGIKYVDKRNYCVGSIYRHSSKFNGHGGSVVSAPASQAKGWGSLPRTRSASGVK